MTSYRTEPTPLVKKPTGGVTYATGTEQFPNLGQIPDFNVNTQTGPTSYAQPNTDLSRVSVPGANVQTIQPGQNDFRGTNITPQPSDRLTSMTGQTDTARSAYAAAPSYTGFQGVSGTGSPYTQTADQLSGQAQSSLPGGYQAVGAGGMGGQSGSLLQQAIGAAGGIGGASFGADTGAARAGTMSALDTLNTAPNRGELASQQFDLLREAGNAGFESDLRRVGQRASALGRIGAGMTTSDLGDVSQRREEALSRDARGLSLDAAGLEMGDRLNRVSANQGVAGTFGGLDLGASGLNAQSATSRAGLLSGLSDQTYGQEMGLRNEARGENDRGLNYGVTQGDYLGRLSDQAFNRGSSLRNEDRDERDTQRRFEEGDLGRVRTQLGDFAGLEDNQRGWEYSDRNELRGERGYQDDLAQTGIDRSIQQRLMEEDLYGSEWGRNQDELSNLYRMGYGTDPTGTLSYQAGNYAQQGANDFAGAGNLLAEYMAGQQPGMSAGTAGQIIGNPTPNVRPGTVTPYVPNQPMQPWRAPVSGR